MDFSLLVFGDDGWGDEMLRGALMTMAVAVCSYLLGVVIGIFFASLKLSQLVVLRYAADFYTTVDLGDRAGGDHLTALNQLLAAGDRRRLSPLDTLSRL